jgi:Uncharacterised nucleotidyltransferase
VSEGSGRTPRRDVIEPDDRGWGVATPVAEVASPWPTRQQELLLEAALGTDDRTITAWEEWKAGARIDAIDRGSKQLLHLAYRNLSARGVRDPFLVSIKPQYRVTWAINQQLFHVLKDTVRHLRDSGIETLVFKGAALIQLYYKDHGVRPMGDVDILVPEDQFHAAADVLLAHRWTTFYHDPQHFDVRFEHAIGFVNRLVESIDLHCHVLMASCEHGADRAFWDRSRPLEIDDVKTRTLSATDHLLHACAHGLLWTPHPSHRWIADAITIMRGSAADIDWKELVATTRERGVTKQVSVALEYLRSTFDAPIPPETLSDLQGTITRSDERRYRLWSRNRRGRPLRLLHHHWAMFRRGTGPVGPIRRMTLVPAYLRFWAQTDRLLTIPWRLAQKALRVVGRRLGLYQYWDRS